MTARVDAASKPDGGGPVLGKRIVFVTGKGGVGKTTVAAAIALAAARRGVRTVLAELSAQRQVPAMLGRRPRGTEAELAPGLRWICLEPRQALRQYLRMRLGALGGALMATRGFGYLAAATPGLSELVTLGELWQLAVMGLGDSRPDLLVVDSPPSGQCIALLRSPTTFAAIARTGPVARQASAINDTLRDPRLTGLAIVALPEELAVRETLELRDELAASPGVALDSVIVNRVHERRFAERDINRVRRALGDTDDLLRRKALQATFSQHARRVGQEEHLTSLSCALGEAPLELPLLVSPPSNAATLQGLGERVVPAER